MWATIQGKHLTIKIDLDRYIPSPDPFFSIFTIDDHILVGACWKGKLEGDESDVYRVFENLLDACSCLLDPEHPHVRALTRFERKNAEEAGFRLKGDEVVVYRGVERNSIYYACSTGRIARIYYHNELLEFTDCPEYKGKHKGVVELSLKEFVEDVLKISREYLEKYASIIDRILIENEHNPGDDYEYLLNFYQEVKKMYEKPSCGSSSLSKKEHWA